MAGLLFCLVDRTKSHLCMTEHGTDKTHIISPTAVVDDFDVVEYLVCIPFKLSARLDYTINSFELMRNNIILTWQFSEKMEKLLLPCYLLILVITFSKPFMFTSASENRFCISFLSWIQYNMSDTIFLGASQSLTKLLRKIRDVLCIIQFCRNRN